MTLHGPFSSPTHLTRRVRRMRLWVPLLAFLLGLTAAAGSSAPGKAMRRNEIPAPVFIGEENVWVNDAGKLELFLPDPNADGWDPSGGADLSYYVQLRQNCVDFFDLWISGDLFPQWVTLDAVDLIFDDYEIVISRSNDLSKDTSPGTVIVGPPESAVSAGLPDEFIEFDRWMLHAPKIAGGFTGTLVVDNLFPELPVRVWVSGFDEAGDLVANSQVSVVVVGQRGSIPLYQDGTTKPALYPSAMTDRISHLALFEEGNRHLTRVALTYQNLSEDALAATVEEERIRSGAAAGTQFTVEARKSANYWDGVAILNLTGFLTTDVRISQKRLGTGEEIAWVPLGSVAPGHKLLAVISDFFAFEPDTYYEVDSTKTDARLQVMGLRGSTTAEKPLLVGSQVFKLR